MPMIATTIINSMRVKPFWMQRFMENSWHDDNALSGRRHRKKAALSRGERGSGSMTGVNAPAVLRVDAAAGRRQELLQDRRAVDGRAATPAFDRLAALGRH